MDVSNIVQVRIKVYSYVGKKINAIFIRYYYSYIMNKFCPYAYK